MKNLPLLLLGAGAVYFIAKKPAKVSTTSAKELPPKNGTLSVGSKNSGYEIYDCEKLIIYNAQKAYDYAFSLGANNGYSTKYDDILFGPCFANPGSPNPKLIMNTPEKAEFAFNLFRYALSGFVQSEPSVENETESLNRLQKIKTKFINDLGFEGSPYKIELIKK